MPSTYPPTHWPDTQGAHRGGPINLIDDQAVGPPTSTQHRLHLCGRLNTRAKGLRAAVITGTVRQGRDHQGSCGLEQGSRQCPWQDSPPGPSCHIYNSKLLHKETSQHAFPKF